MSRGVDGCRPICIGADKNPCQSQYAPSTRGRLRIQENQGESQLVTSRDKERETSTFNLEEHASRALIKLSPTGLADSPLEDTTPHSFDVSRILQGRERFIGRMKREEECILMECR